MGVWLKERRAVAANLIHPRGEVVGVYFVGGVWMAMAKWGRLSTGLRLSMNQLIEEVNEQHRSWFGPPISRRSFLKVPAQQERSSPCPRSMAGPCSARTPRATGSMSPRSAAARLEAGTTWDFWARCPTCESSRSRMPTRSRREAAAAKLNEQYGEKNAVTAYADFREILARPDVDAVIVGAHDNWHTPMSIAAAKAGKDVYCQKPLALDFSLTKTLREVIRDKKRIFQFGTQYRSRTGIGTWSNWFATVTSANCSGWMSGAATCRST